MCIVNKTEILSFFCEWVYFSYFFFDYRYSVRYNSIKQFHQSELLHEVSHNDVNNGAKNITRVNAQHITIFA